MKSRLKSMTTLKFTASLLALKERETTQSTLPLLFRGGGSTEGLRLMTERVILMLNCLPFYVLLQSHIKIMF